MFEYSIIHKSLVRLNKYSKVQKIADYPENVQLSSGL